MKATVKELVTAVNESNGTIGIIIRALFGVKTKSYAREPERAPKGSIVKNLPDGKGGKVWTKLELTESAFTKGKDSIMESAEYKAASKSTQATIRSHIRHLAREFGYANGKPRGKTAKKTKAEKPTIETSKGVKEMSLEQLRANITTITRAWMKNHSFDKVALTATLEKTVHDAING